MKIALKDFRAFQETGLIEIRPLTFLVGENSSGKTSLMAALNYIWRLSDPLTPVSINSPPFDLGTFDELVHRVRGRTKPNCFEIMAEEVVTIDPQRSSFFYLTRATIKRMSDKARLRLTFEDNVGDAVITKLELSFSRYNLKISIDDKISIVIVDDLKNTIFDSTQGQEELGFKRSAKSVQIIVDEMVYYLRRLIIERETSSNEIDEVHIALSVVGSALEQLLETFPNAVFASAPVRSNPSRVYTPADQNRTPEGTHTPQRLFKIKESNPASWEKIKSGLERFGRLSGMYSAINVARYRSSGASPFHINVTRKGKQSNIVDVGYGVSQALPILTDLIESPPRSAFLFQQPEVHLHPQAQAALGSFFVDHIADKRKSVIVAETHSDYLIDRARMAVREKVIRPRDISILYFQSEGTSTSVFTLEVDSQGNITHTPPGYRSFFVREQMNVLGLP